MHNNYLEQAFVDVHPASLNSANTKHSTAPLHNMSLAVKDLFDVKGIPTGAGNPDWLRTHPIPNKTNSTVATLIAQGAVYKGKTLTDELAYSLNGQNIHYPALVNPNNPERFAGGSSSGSAVAVATMLADIGLGTDTGGSIRVPASYNGLFGIRTSHGLLPMDNMVPLAPSFDTIGWMCSSIDELEKVAQVLLPEQDESALSAVTQEPLKLSISNNLIACSEQSDQIKLMVKAIDDSNIVDCDQVDISVNTFKISETFRTLQGYEIWQQHGDWISRTQPTFASDIQKRFNWCQNITLKDYNLAKQRQQSFHAYINSHFQKYDVILLPTTPGLSPLLNTPAKELGEYRNNLMTFTAIAGLAGLPQIHLPLFTINKASCGVSLIAPKNQDLRLIHIAKKLMKHLL
ncbi:MAG: Asp-tRNA(Asn)/Glu-tRNA(Gln) amidotransferase A subunit family amidase [Alphaproteobacteria bacterium]